MSKPITSIEWFVMTSTGVDVIAFCQPPTPGLRPTSGRLLLFLSGQKFGFSNDKQPECRRGEEEKANKEAERREELDEGRRRRR
jgi:hypothetical protein